MKHNFFSYCDQMQASFLPLKGDFYGFTITNDGNIRIDKNAGCLKIPVKLISNDVCNDLKKFLAVDCHFIYNRKKAKNIITLLN